MIFHETNFLTESEFNKLSVKTEYLYRLAKLEDGIKVLEEYDKTLGPEQGIYNKEISRQYCKRFRFWCNGDDVWEETIQFFGPDIEQPLIRLKQYLIDKGWSNIKLSNIWFQYGDQNTEMHRHHDGQIHGAEYKNCFTSMIFVHREWQEDWGGTFHIDSVDTINDTTSFVSEPNSLLMWNRDHPHWMAPIIRDDIPLRMFLGMSWYEK